MSNSSSQLGRDLKLIAQATERKAWWKVALVTVPVIVVLGNLSGLLSNSGYSNPWFDAVRKPGFMPPGWVFGVAWTILYTLMGLSVAMVISAPNSAWRRRGLIFFTVQLVLNYLWSPVFFGAAAIDVGFLIIIAMAVALCLTISLFWRVEKVAALLLLPYLAWLCLATALNFEIGRLNPGADRAPLGITGG